VLAPGCHGGMFDHNTIRVLTSFRFVFLTLDLCFRQATNDSSKGATVMIVHAIVISTIIKSTIPACCFVDLVSSHR
jgi:hypothetical protein